LVSLVKPMGIDDFILSYEWANWNWVPLFHFPSLSYINLNL
jgi:hypothetical protein